MSEIVESNDMGDVIVPHSVISHPAPHKRYRVDIEGNTLMLVPVEEPTPQETSQSVWARSFLDWVNAPRPPAPFIDDDATRRESMYD